MLKRRTVVNRKKPSHRWAPPPFSLPFSILRACCPLPLSRNGVPGASLPHWPDALRDEGQGPHRQALRRGEGDAGLP